MPDSSLAEIQQRTFARATSATRRAYPPERQLTGDQLSGYLDRCSIGVVSSVRPDGRPHSALSSYLRRGATFWLPTLTGTVRERNVRAAPWLVLVVTEGNRAGSDIAAEASGHIAVIVEGPGAVIAPTDAPGDVIDVFPKKWVSAWLRLDAEHLLSYADEGMTGQF